MTTVLRGVALWVLIGVIGVSAGCVKLKQVITVMPDGSGKIDLRYGLSAEQIEMAKQSDVAPFKEVMPGVIQHTCSGLIAFTEPVTTRDAEDGYTYLSYTAYFSDINQLRIGGLGEGRPTSYRLTREGEGATLTVSNGTTLSMLAGYKPVPEHERERSRKAMAGLELSEHYILPGEPKPADGLTIQNKTAMLDLRLDDLIEGTGPVKALQGKNTLTLTIPAFDTDENQLAAFKQEMQEAVKTWQAKQRDN